MTLLSVNKARKCPEMTLVMQLTSESSTFWKKDLGRFFLGKRIHKFVLVRRRLCPEQEVKDLWHIWSIWSVRSVRESNLSESPIGLTDWPHRFESPIGLTDRPHTASHGLTDRPHRSDSLTDHMTYFVRPICEAVWGHVRPIGLSNLWGRSVRPIGLSNLWGRSVRPWDAEHGLSLESHVICQRVRLASHGLTDRPHRFESPISLTDRPHRFESPIGLSRTPAESPILGAIWLISRLNALPHPVESNVGLPRPHRSASQIGLTDLRVRSASHAHRPRVRSSGLSDWLIPRTKEMHLKVI